MMFAPNSSARPSQQDENIHDVLQLLVALMSEHPASMIPAFDQRNGIRWVMKATLANTQGYPDTILGTLCKQGGPKKRVSPSLHLMTARIRKNQVLKMDG